MYRVWILLCFSEEFFFLNTRVLKKTKTLCVSDAGSSQNLPSGCATSTELRAVGLHACGSGVTQRFGERLDAELGTLLSGFFLSMISSLSSLCGLHLWDRGVGGVVCWFKLVNCISSQVGGGLWQTERGKLSW